MMFIDFLKNNLGTIIVAAILILTVAVLIRSLVKRKRSGKSSCSCGCSSCAMSGQCHGSKD